MTGFFLVLLSVWMSFGITNVHGNPEAPGPLGRIENHLYYIEEKLDNESKIRRESIKSIRDMLHNVKSEPVGRKTADIAVENKPVQVVHQGETRTSQIQALLKAFHSEKLLNKRLRRQVGDLDNRFGEINKTLSYLEDGNKKVHASLDNLEKALNDVKNTVDRNAERTSDALSILSNLDDKTNEIRTLMNVPNEKFESCKQLLESGYTTSGLYDIYPANRPIPLRVSCDQTTDGGGWVVFQRREDGSENFYRTWIEYKFGFGNLEGEFWLGNIYLHLLTTSICGQLRIDMEDFEGERRYAKYGQFSIGSLTENFQLGVSQYTGDAGNSLTGHNGYGFSTYDKDNDIYDSNCASVYKGAWWYTKCHSSNLNGHYFHGHHKSYADGVNWKPWKGYHDSLKFTEMKCR